MSETIERIRAGGGLDHPFLAQARHSPLYNGTLTEIYVQHPWRHKLWKSAELANYSNIFPIPTLFNIYLHDHGTEAEARMKMFQGLAKAVIRTAGMS